MLIITFTRKLLFLSPLWVRKLSANNAQKTLYLLVSSQLLSGEGIETSILLPTSPIFRRWPRRGGTMAATSTAGATSSMCAALTAPRPSLRIRLGSESYGFRTPTFFSSGDPQVRDQEHCWGCGCQGHLWGQRLHQVCSTPWPKSLEANVMYSYFRSPDTWCHTLNLMENIS